MQASDLLWQLYVEALEAGLRIPRELDFLAAASDIPLPLNIASTGVDPVPLPQALAEVYRLGDTMPAWVPAYQPSADGRVFAVDDAYVFSIDVPPDGGAPYRPVREARRLLRQVEDEIAAGFGSLVMRIATDSGERVVPRYETGPLGVPGYSQWLDFAILAVVHKLPPEVDVTVYADAGLAGGRRLQQTARRAGPPASFPPFLRLALAGDGGRPLRFAPSSALAALEAGDIVSLRLVIQSTTYLPLQPGPWFVASLLRTYTRPEQFISGTPFARGPIWGPEGIFNLLTTGLYAGFRPEVTVTLAPAALARLAAEANLEIRAAGVDTSLSGELLGVVVDAPNWGCGP
jgi:hypothetical protein